MKKSTRVLCLVIAAAFVVTLLFSIVMSIAYAEEGGEAASRGETVYVTADANGNVESVISSVYLSNTARLDTLTDHTSLMDIKAITTNDPPVINGDAVTFAAGGSDVSYQGTASADALPFSVRIAYYLNGREIAPEELAGKSGRVRIEIAAENRLKRTADVDGETVELYVPFSIIGMLTFGEGFSGVTAENAKVSVQAGQITVLAVLLPGLAESLGMEPGDKINDTLAIEATVENFSFSGGTFIGMTGIVDQNDLSGIEDVQTLMDALDQLNDAAGELYKGARRISRAADTYAGGVLAYAEGVAQALDGVGTVTEGVSQLYSGARQLVSGSGEITDGLSALAEQLEQLKGYLDTIESGTVDESLYTLLVSYAVEIAQKTVDESGDQMRQKLRESLASAMPGASPDVIEAIVNEVLPEDMTVSEPELTEEQKAEIAAEVAKILKGSGNAQDLIKRFDALVSGMNQLADGSGKVTDGMASLTSGLYQLKEGLADFSGGAEELSKNGTALAEGADSIANGVASIAKGLRSLANDGMQRIVDETAEIDVSLARKDALIALSQSYSSFSATQEPEDGAVQFLISTEGIEEELPIEPSPSPDAVNPGAQSAPADTEAETGFFESIGAWFAGIFAGIRSWFKG